LPQTIFIGDKRAACAEIATRQQVVSAATGATLKHMSDIPDRNGVQSGLHSANLIVAGEKISQYRHCRDLFAKAPRYVDEL